MAGFTKKAIRDAFIQLLNDRPLSQITVKDIVETCGVNRNTFYYYYQDIPHLLQTTVNEESERIIRDNPTIGSIEECLNAAIAFALENRKAALHIFRSVNRDIFEQHLWQICRHVITVYYNEILEGRNISDEDRSLLIENAMYSCFGFIIAWMERGMTGDIQARFQRLCEIRQGEVQRMISRCEETA